MKEFLLYALVPLLGVVIGWLLNQASTAWHSKVRLFFSLSSTPENELVEKELRTKTSLSEYSIDIYNSSQTPCFLEYISLMNKSTILADCFLDKECRLIKPHECVTYRLMEQDLCGLERCCKGLKEKKCKVIAHGVGGKTYRGKLDISPFALILSMQADAGIVSP